MSRRRFLGPWLWLALLTSGAGCNALFDITSPQHKPDAGLACTLNSDCGALPGTVCLFARCSPPCAADIDCTAPGARCLHASVGTACVTQAQASCADGRQPCPTGTTCANGACYGTCQDNASCADGHTCVSNVCNGPATNGGAGGMSGAGGGGAGGSAAGGVDGGTVTLTVTISSPAATYYTNGSVTIQGVVSGGTADEIQLLVDDAVFAKLPSTAQYTWDTSAVAEGSHQLVLRAVLGSAQFDSAALTVVVDRTPPTVVASVPPANGGNVFLDDPISATFSEPLLPVSVQTGAATLSAQTGGAVTSALSLSADGKTLSLTRQGSVSVPNTLTATLSTGLKDLAGNALAAPLSWSFDAPAWVTLGGAINPLPSQTVSACRLGPVDSAGRPSLVVVEPNGTNDVAYFERWDGSAWVQVGDAINADSAFGFALASPMLVLHDATGLLARQWSGSSWSSPGDPLNPVPTQIPSSFTAVANANGQLGVVLLESGGTNVHAYAETWTGTAWQLFGGALIQQQNQPVTSANIALSAAGQPTVVIAQTDLTFVNAYVAQWSGTAWTWLAGAINALAANVVTPNVVLQSDGTPVVAFAELDPSTNVTNAYAFRWSGTKWVALGGPINAVSGQSITFGAASLALDATDHPLALVREGSAFVMRWSGSAWSVLGEAANPLTGRAVSTTTMLSDDKGRPMLGVLENDGARRNCYVERSNQ